MPLLRSSGSTQMAIDRWLLEQHRRGLHPPTLRFYTWSPPAISLGYHQQEWPPHWQGLTWQGQSVELVRRPTGGRAVLHQGDLTYAAIVSGIPGSRIQVYERICEFLTRGWQSLGVRLHYGRAGKSYARTDNCFATATGADLVTDAGVKFIGSAQLRRGDAILQHGSMRLDPDGALFARVFGEGAVPQISWKKRSLATIIEALTIAAGECFEVEFVERSLGESELQAALNWPPASPKLQ
ncbi:MAG: biotin/lipoate A/B protein ligase family protein [Cyanobacteriota bacterium]|nr:biotin/lipoate A/B protein ligase family protein [Cyanobacteriota bacterium]